MNKLLLTIAAILAMSNAFAQIDVKSSGSTSDIIVNEINGIIAPHLKGVELRKKDQDYGAEQTGAMVYITEALKTGEISDKTVNVTSIGYYYFDGNIWVKQKTGEEKGSFQKSSPPKLYSKGN